MPVSNLHPAVTWQGILDDQRERAARPETGRADLHLPLGAGMIDIAGHLRALKASGYDGTIPLEVFTTDRQHLAYSRDVRRRLWDAEEAPVRPSTQNPAPSTAAKPPCAQRGNLHCGRASDLSEGSPTERTSHVRMATTQLEVLALWARARRETDAASRISFLTQAEQLTAAETDPREKQFARRVLAHFRRWIELKSPESAARATARADRRRYRMAPARG